MSKVAIITRTSNRPLFLTRALTSVAAQSYQDYVHVIVNDAGDRQVIEDVVKTTSAAHQEKIKLFHRDQFSNAPDTIFNESIDRVDSKYVVIHDDDDSWHEDFLQQTVKHLDAKPELGGVVVSTNKVIERVEGESLRVVKTMAWMPDIKVVNLYRQHIDNQLTPIAFLFRRNAYEQVGKFDSSLPVIGDWEFGIRFLKRFDVDVLNPGFALANYHHREHQPGAEGNTSFAGNDRHRYYSNLVMNKYLRDELAAGQLGSGYIMSQLKYNQSNLATMLRKVLPGVVVNRLKRLVSN